MRQLEAALARKGEELSELNKIGVALSAERDIDKLLDADPEQEPRDHQRRRGQPLPRRARRTPRAKAAPPTGCASSSRRTTPWTSRSRSSRCRSTTPRSPATSALTGRVLNVADAYQLPEDSPFQISRSFDARSGYRTKSVLVVPMRDHENTIIGVVQLINKKRDPNAVLRPVSLVEEEVVPFTSVDEELVSSLASQAAVAFENAELIARHPRALRRVRPRRGDGGRAARPDDARATRSGSPC